MFQIGTDWNPLQTRLKEIITKQDYFEEMQQLTLKMHSLVHSNIVYENQETTFMEEIWKNLTDKAFRTMPTLKDDTIAWNIWHITRIEDLTSNYLIAGSEEILDDNWLVKLNINIRNTGNAMTNPEIIDFTNKVDRTALYEYRNAVGRRTKEILHNLHPEDMKRKVAKEGLDKIESTGGVTQHPDSIWLLDFWGRKNIAGIIQMPITRHQIVHLNDARRLKKVCERMK